MVNEDDCNGLAITELLFQHHPAISETIASNCNAGNIAITVIKGANDYWCRDFMPLNHALSADGLQHPLFILPHWLIKVF